MMNDPIVVTGIGMVTPLGMDRETTWENCIASRTGIREINGKLIPAAGIIPDLRDRPSSKRAALISLMAASEALMDSGIHPEQDTHICIGSTVSCSKPPLDTIIQGCFTHPSDVLQRYFKFTGPVTRYAAACATGLVSIHAGMRMIQMGLCDMCLVGSIESSLDDLYCAGFVRLGVIADTSKGHGKAVRPFEQNRSGFLPGEGGAVMVLEKKSHVLGRQGHMYGEISSCSIGNDAHDPVMFNAGGKCIAEVIQNALSQAGMSTYDDCYINAHGTGTRLNDWLETQAIKQTFGRKAYHIPVSSTKAGTGHLLGAAGSVETALCLCAIRDQIIPPTLNYEIPDPECDLNYTAFHAQHKTISRAVSLSYGFGGHIGAIVLKKTC
ncbi:MAG: hypothetical protein GF384_00110 [Elusimicrobia bacterium]|nr:hypothetical protein [Elusimicrobiota bacterium]MBD3411500.1 hypothetical protein [Elusimicrobiota bacterium]